MQACATQRLVASGSNCGDVGGGFYGGILVIRGSRTPGTVFQKWKYARMHTRVERPHISSKNVFHARGPKP